MKEVVLLLVATAAVIGFVGFITLCALLTVAYSIIEDIITRKD